MSPEQKPGSPVRAGRRAAAAALALVLSAGVAFADDSVSVPVASRARKSLPIPQGDKIELTLQKTIEMTLQNVLDLDVAAYNLEESHFGILSARGAFDPNFELDLGIKNTETPRSSIYQANQTKTGYANPYLTGLLPYGTTYTLGWTNTRSDVVGAGTLLNPTYSSNLSLGVTQPLLRNFGKTVTERFVVQAKLGENQSGYGFVIAVQTAIQTAENAYWDLVYAVENLKAKQEALDRAKDLNRITKIKIDVGALAPIDIVQTEVTIAQREQDIIIAEGLIGDAQDRLRRLLNVQSVPDWNRPIVPTDRPTRESLRTGFVADVNQGYESALKVRPEIRQALLNIESKKVTAAYQQNQLKPRLDLSGGYGRAGLGANGLGVDADGNPYDLSYSSALTQIGRGDYPAWNVGLVFAIPIGNRAAKGNAAIANADLELARTSLAITKANLHVEVRAAARNIDTAYRSVQAASKARELAERNLDAEKKKYENGMTTSFQVAQIQNDLTTARTIELQAVAGYLKSLVSWHKAIGDLLPQKNVVLSGLNVSLDPTPAEEGAVR
ncbi:MAG TPA: TolC family protein [Thermoanaerobaculia bacterium]|nr:TolC family protein [Thermoanaerobaculia bacterium]